MVVRYHFSEDNPRFEIHSLLTQKKIVEYDSTLDRRFYDFAADNRMFHFLDSVINPTDVMEIGMIAYGVGFSSYIDYDLSDDYLEEFCSILRTVDDLPF